MAGDQLAAVQAGERDAPLGRDEAGWLPGGEYRASPRQLPGLAGRHPAGATGSSRTMDTAALAAAFPFSSPDLPRDPAAPHPD